VANNNYECLDCNPPREFRSIQGKNGHMQFKHNKSGEFVQRPPSKQTEMIQQVLDQQQMLLNRQQALYELFANTSDESIGVFGGNNNNQALASNNQGNNNQALANNDQGNNNQALANNDQEGNDNGQQEYFCLSGRKGNCKTPVFPGQEHCPSCREPLDWGGIDR